MIAIKDLVKQYGTQQKLADAMGVATQDVSRWSRGDYMVIPLTGEIYRLTRTVNALTGGDK